MGQIVAFDSNVFVYVLERDGVFWQPSLAALKRAESGELTGVASELVYLEATVASKLSANEIYVVENLLKASRLQFMPISLPVLRKAAALRRLHPSIRTPDAIHLASAIENKAEFFVTNDQNILKQKIRGIKLVNLKSAESLISNVN